MQNYFFLLENPYLKSNKRDKEMQNTYLWGRNNVQILEISLNPRIFALSITLSIENMMTETNDRRLPVGIQSFEKVTLDNNTYNVAASYANLHNVSKRFGISK